MNWIRQGDDNVWKCGKYEIRAVHHLNALYWVLLPGWQEFDTMDKAKRCASQEEEETK